MYGDDEDISGLIAGTEPRLSMLEKLMINLESLLSPSKALREFYEKQNAQVQGLIEMEHVHGDRYQAKVS